MLARSLQLELKITQFRLNSVYQFTQQLRIVKHLLSRKISFLNTTHVGEIILIIGKRELLQLGYRKDSPACLN